jgi:Cytochrome c oxidase assembly protein COX16
MGSPYRGTGRDAFFKVGLPMLALVGGGMAGASYMVQARYDLHDRGGKINKDAALKRLFRDPESEEARAEQLRRKEQRDFDLEREIERINQSKDLDDYVMKRVERPPGE